VQSISGGDATYTALYTKSPAWKDVVIIPKGGTAKLQVQVADCTGMCMFGMMGILEPG
jgi:hypothetical protein